MPGTKVMLPSSPEGIRYSSLTDWPKVCFIPLMEVSPLSIDVAGVAVAMEAQTKNPKVPRSAQPWVATMVRTIYQQPSPQEVHAQLERVIAQLQDPFPQVASRLDEAVPDVLAFSSFPVAHWKKICSNNPLERLNKEIRRRTDVVGIFPNRPAVRRLVGAVLAEQHDEWAVGRRYMTQEVTTFNEALPRTELAEAAA